MVVLFEPLFLKRISTLPELPDHSLFAVVIYSLVNQLLIVDKVLNRFSKQLRFFGMYPMSGFRDSNHL
ncbi:hypothetical protein SAMN05444380_106133 [Thermophagus xiamenensis]|uniref:Uncharacterized protein n=1 Tax=Thermophagus xiamenensis TaxID=385682 RepID=A0A1I1XTI8_9BACT|nr:hypothetical protein SAMN05444380_106133 [Thermophagus xiamenensis]